MVRSPGPLSRVVSPCLAFLVLFAAGLKAQTAYLGTDTGEFGTINLSTGVFSLLGNSGQTLAGMAVANGKLYATSYHTATGTLYTINPANGSLSVVGTSATNFDDFGSTTTGLYAVGFDGNLYSVNSANGTTTQIGPIGISFGSWRGLSTNAGALYFANGPNLYTLNTTTGAATLVGPMGGGVQIGALLQEGGVLYAGVETPSLMVDTINITTGTATVGPALTVATGHFYALAPNPLPSSSTYYFSDLAFSGDYQTTLTYINYSPQPVTCVTNFYSDAGAPLSIPFGEGTISSRTDVLPPGGSLHDQTIANLTATVTEGWAQASCTGPVEASLLYRLYNSSGVAVGEASVNAETAPTTQFATFAQAAANSTGIAYANPSTTQSATITFAAYNEAGTKLGSQTLALGPLQHSSANVEPLFGLSNFTGFVEITSTIPIISLSLNAEAFPVFSSLPPGDLPSSTNLVGSGSSGTTSGPQSYYFSDLAFSGGYQTTLTYVNYSPQTVTCTTNFYSDSGSPLSIPFSEETVSTRTDVLQPGQSIHDQTVANLAPPYVEGWAQASCSGPVEASLLYRLYNSSGVAVGEASVNAETAPTTEFATFAQTATGIAYGNPSTTQSASVTVEVYSATGAVLGTHVITLGPLQHGSANVGPLLGLASFTGFVKITSTIPIVSLSLNAEAFPVFSSLPPGDLAGGTTLVTP